MKKSQQHTSSLPKSIKVRRSAVHALGLYTKEVFAQDARIIEYVGKKITWKQAEQQDEDNQRIYLFAVNDRHLVDGDVGYNSAKYINHSCEPNCYIDIENDRIWIYALRPISKGEELSYDYGFDRWGWQDRLCLCQSINCFGYIVARKYWSAIRNTKRYYQLQNIATSRKIEERG